MPRNAQSFRAAAPVFPLDPCCCRGCSSVAWGALPNDALPIIIVKRGAANPDRSRFSAWSRRLQGALLAGSIASQTCGRQFASSRVLWQNRAHMQVRVVAFVLAGGKATRLLPLTKERAKPAVAFGGR